MQKQLFFICPTDFIESTINDAFGPDHVFITSLGNSISFDDEMTMTVNNLIAVKTIRHVSFVLSDDNRIVADALTKKSFSDLIDLNKFYRNIDRQKRQCEEVWPPSYHQFLISSYFLNHKLMQLRAELDDETRSRVNLSAKIYKRKEGVFRDICSFSVVRDCVVLN